MVVETADDREQCVSAAKSFQDRKQSSLTHHIERLCEVNKYNN